MLTASKCAAIPCARAESPRQYIEVHCRQLRSLRFTRIPYRQILLVWCVKQIDCYIPVDRMAQPWGRPLACGGLLRPPKAGLRVPRSLRGCPTRITELLSHYTSMAPDVEDCFVRDILSAVHMWNHQLCRRNAPRHASGGEGTDTAVSSVGVGRKDHELCYLQR